MHARYWAFLFGNLQRAVDGIYQTCEEDENISECKEVILVLENYTRDFHNLIEWFRVKWAYEKSPPPLRRTPLAWEVRKTSPCRMWNSTMIPKSTSPLQRGSPTEFLCKSPVEQIACECKSVVTDNRVNNIKEEVVLKLLKDNKNNVCKNCCSDIKEKCKNGGVDKVGNQTTNKEKSTSTKAVNKVLVKQSVQTKTHNLADRKKLNETCDSKNKIDVKNVSKQTKDCLRSNLVKLADSNISVEKREQLCKNDKSAHSGSYTNCEPTQKEVNCVNNGEDKPDGKGMNSKLSCNKSNTGLGKNEINAKVKRDSIRKGESNVNTEKLSTKPSVVHNSSEKTNQVDSQINTHSHEVDEKSSDIRNSAVNISSSNVDKCSVTFNTSRPAYSTISQIRSKVQSSASSETPKFSRSKTCLSGQNLPTPNKTRPGTSVIVRGRFQTLENKVFFFLCI